MNRDCDLSNPLVRDGVSQAQRLLPALDPDNPRFFKVDERTTEDLLCWLHRYAKQLQFYDGDNRPAGDWQVFIEKDISSAIARMSKSGGIKVFDCYQALVKVLKEAAGFGPVTKTAFKILFDLIFNLARDFNQWQSLSVEGLATEPVLQRIITTQLREPFRAAIFYFYFARSKGDKFLDDEPSAIPEDCKDDLAAAEDILTWPFNPAWVISKPEETISWEAYREAVRLEAEAEGGDSIFSDVATAAGRLQKLFDAFYNARRQLGTVTHGFLEATIADWPNHEPHMALMIAFLQLFKIAQDHLNTLTTRHLDFYYQKILQFKEKSQTADRVHLVFELAKQTSSHLLKSGTLLKAGKDSQGKEVAYQLDGKIVVNRASVAELKSVFLDGDDDHRAYAAPKSNSSDGQGAEFDAEEPRWKPFGESQKENSQFRPPRRRTMQFARIGFGIASPILRLKEGARAITLEITLSQKLVQDFPLGKIGKDSVVIEFSGEEGWTKATNHDVKITLDGILTVTANLDVTGGAIIDYDPKLHGGSYTSTAPIMTVTLAHNPGGPFPYAYQLLKDLVIASIDVTATVQGAQDLIVQNDLGLLDAAKPFMPFGASPVKGSRFYIGSDEIFRKQVTQLAICFEWLDRPSDFSTHYQVYNAGKNIFTNNAFKIDLAVLQNRSWGDTPLSSNVELFSNLGDTVADCPHQSFHLKEQTEPITQEAPALDPVIAFDNSTQQGFIRWELTGPNEAFGHQMFPRVYARQVIKLTNAGSGSQNGEKKTTPGPGMGAMATIVDQTPQLPEEPYTPVIKSIHLDYTATAKIDLTTGTDVSKRTHCLLHIYPFGHCPVPGPAAQTLYLLPQFNYSDSKVSLQNEGELYIGLKELAPRQNLTLLFQVAEGSANPELPKQQVNWSYLSKNTWQAFAPNQILADSSNGLLTSGIIILDVPKAADDRNTLLPAGLHWLRASVSRHAAAVCDLIEVRAQAAQASFFDQDNAADYLATNLPKKNIKKLKVKQAAIKAVHQPYASFGGKVAEQQRQFYTRISERLRHKNRGIAIWDYERLVLEKFPTIYKAKCVNHSTYNFSDEVYGLQIKRSEFAPGFVTLIVIPDLNNKNAVDPLEPRASLNTLDEIRKYLSLRVSPHAARRLRVINPLYEKVQVQFGVEFHSGYDRGYYVNELNRDIIHYLSPWAFEEGQDIVFGGRLHKSVIINFVEERHYVDYVTNFIMNHFPGDDQALNDVDEILPTTARSIIVSHKQHKIEEATEES